MSAQSHAILTERRGGALWIRFNRPAKLNAFDLGQLDDIQEALLGAEADDDVCAVVITGIGKAFCAGADLGAVGADLHQGQLTAFVARVATLMRRIESFPKPVVAAVNGIATGGGLELLLCCDVAFAADNARVGDGHANYGLIPGAGATVRLPRRIGVSNAKYLFFCGDTLPSGDPRVSTLFAAIVPADELDATVSDFVCKMKSKSALALRALKALVNGGLDYLASEAHEREARAVQIHAESFDCQEGVAAFLEKRAPRFRGI
jgi:enoyl-CoA hydratase/carnithine racemase